MFVEVVIEFGSDAPGVFGGAVEVGGGGVEFGEIKTGHADTEGFEFEWWDRDRFEKSTSHREGAMMMIVRDGEACREKREFEEENEEEVDKGEGRQKLQRSPRPFSHSHGLPACCVLPIVPIL